MSHTLRGESRRFRISLIYNSDWSGAVKVVWWPKQGHDEGDEVNDLIVPGYDLVRGMVQRRPKNPEEAEVLFRAVALAAESFLVRRAETLVGDLSLDQVEE